MRWEAPPLCWSELLGGELQHDGRQAWPKQPERRQLDRYREWQLHEAEAHLSELVHRACEEGPQRITVPREDAVVVVAAGEFAQLLASLRPEHGLHPLLSESPLRDFESARRVSAVPYETSRSERNAQPELLFAGVPVLNPGTGELCE